ncbi:MAG: clan AA aspartic protease [Gemmataceae bacterium]
MIRGVVTSSREPVVHLRVRGPGGATADIELVLDTGFTGALVLPAAVVAALGLPWQSGGTAVLADGSTHQTDYYEAELEWGPGWVSVLAMSVGPESLLGMRLLAGHRLTVEGSPGGAVEIAPWP